MNLKKRIERSDRGQLKEAGQTIERNLKKRIERTQRKEIFDKIRRGELESQKED